jgi:DNA-directed RNA polymerase alpha subunit
MNKTPDHFISSLSAPARRALENSGIKTIEAVSKYSEKEILKLHGIGKSAIPVLKQELKKNGLAFKD